MIKSKLAIFALFVSLGASAQVTVPNTFSTGTAASAAAVNSNFTALVNAINATNARVAKLEGTGLVAADFAGTYTLSGLQTELNSNHIAHYHYAGMITLNSDLSATYTISGSSGGGQWNPNMAVPNNAAPTSGAFPVSLADNGTTTWTYSAGTITINSFGSINFSAASTKLLVRAGSDLDVGTGNRTSNVLILTRL
jgi:hypothetical protein